VTTPQHQNSTSSEQHLGEMFVRSAFVNKFVDSLSLSIGGLLAGRNLKKRRPSNSDLVCLTSLQGAAFEIFNRADPSAPQALDALIGRIKAAFDDTSAAICHTDDDIANARRLFDLALTHARVAASLTMAEVQGGYPVSARRWDVWWPKLR
jgi:hypothetical protein